MKISEFSKTDAREVAELSNRNWEVFRYKKVEPEFISRFCDHPFFKMFVLRENGKLVGFCGANWEKAPAEIGPICVEERYRRKGIGRALISFISDFLEKLNIKKVFVKVKEQNKSGISFFVAMGFKEIGTFEDHEGTPIVFLGKEIN